MQVTNNVIIDLENQNVTLDVRNTIFQSNTFQNGHVTFIPNSKTLWKDVEFVNITLNIQNIENICEDNKLGSQKPPYECFFHLQSGEEILIYKNYNFDNLNLGLRVTFDPQRKNLQNAIFNKNTKWIQCLFTCRL